MITQQIAYLTSFLILGILVTASYVKYWPTYNMWAGLNNKISFYIWSVSTLLSIAGFLSFTIRNILYTSEPLDYYRNQQNLALIPYILFLFLSALYMPLASKKRVPETMAILLGVAISAWALVYFSNNLFHWNYTTILITFLAVHCTFLDLGYWGWTWTKEIQNEDKLLGYDQSYSNMNTIYSKKGNDVNETLSDPFII